MHAPSVLSLGFVLPALASPPFSRTESWTIPTMEVHSMGPDTGLPGNIWPEDRKFNTTLDFALTLPSTQVQCSANWKYQQVSTAEWPCGDNAGTSFHLSPTPAGVFNDNAWTLTITRDWNDVVSYVAHQDIENSGSQGPNSYLGCTGGPQYDGVRCKLNGFGGRPGPISLTAISQW